MFKHQFIEKKSNHQPQKDQKGKLYSTVIILIYLFLNSTLLQVLPALAASPTPGTVIDNQATGSFIDSTDNTEKQIESNIVKVTVAEVAGITITPANTPSASTGSTTNFDFTVTNVGNDPTQFFIPDAPSAISGGTAGTLKIVAYDPDGTGPAAAVDLTSNNITVPSGGRSTGTLLGAIASANNGSIPAGASIVVRVPVTVTAADGQTVSVTLGNTSGQPSNSNTPYILGANGTGSKDVYTDDNADNISGESAGAPINGDPTNHRQEASASQTVTVVNTVVTVSGTVFRDADGSVTINGSDVGTNAGSTNLTIYAIDTAGKVVDKATVAPNGTYSLPNVPVSSSVTLRLSNDSTVAIGATAPTTPSLPSNWVNTGENKNGTTETTTPGDIAITTAKANIINQDFGIEQLPDTTNLNPAPQTNPGGTATIQVPTLAGTDPEDGALGSGNKFKIVTLPTNGTLTYNNVAVTAGQIISSYNPTLLKLDPQDGAITVSFTYAAIDAANKEDATPATVTIPFVTRANVLLVKRITAINGDRTKNPNDNTALNAFVDDTTSTRQADDNSPNWKSGYLLGAIDAGKVKPGDEIEYTVYFLNAGSSNANTVRVCDRLSGNQDFKGSAYGTNKDIQLQLGTSTVLDLTSASDTSDRAQLISAGGTVPTNCYLKAANDNGTLVIDITGNTGVPNLTTIPGSTAQGSPNDSYGFFRFVTKVKP
ncbi:hypothetical protein PQG02_06200 [Nostoc sp. UHCC 0926]|uniref:hypothetical protein n=1 Tax=unclassified Nostoc TaxID=2593658 RepID=UPI00235E90A1|nr:hypothetical protein [Nostoc sp. UHCC 0926]WDD33948.1 hypothetical protein PQG02_06200 [Nostoc sp. UHCC 0926]